MSLDFLTDIPVQCEWIVSSCPVHSLHTGDGVVYGRWLIVSSVMTPYPSTQCNDLAQGCLTIPIILVSPCHF